MIIDPSLFSACLSAKVAEVLGVLADLHLLDDLTQAGAITRCILAHNAHLQQEQRVAERQRDLNIKRRQREPENEEGLRWATPDIYTASRK